MCSRRLSRASGQQPKSWKCRKGNIKQYLVVYMCIGHPAVFQVQRYARRVDVMERRVHLCTHLTNYFT